MRRQYVPSQSRPRAAFTLIELIVVITVLLIILGFTVSAVNFSVDNERVSAGARQVQSYLAGAKDRAIHAKDARGVRFVLAPSDPADPASERLVDSLMFVRPAEPWSEGNIRLERFAAGDRRASVVAASTDSGWWELAKRKLMGDTTSTAGIAKGVNLRIRIPNDRTGSWYTITSFYEAGAPVWTPNVPPIFNPANNTTTDDDPYPLKVRITPPYRDPATNPANDRQAFAGGGPNTYRLELPSVILPEEPAILPKGTVIDLDSSDVPRTWAVRGGSSNRDAFLDVMFSPRGSVVGSAASTGVLHFYVTKREIVDLFRQHNSGLLGIPAEEVGAASDPQPIGDRALVTLFTRTGSAGSFPIDPTDTDGDGFADDPYRFAETGEEKKQ